MPYGQITEQEAVERGLLRHARCIVGDGTEIAFYWHAPTGLYWIVPDDMPESVAPPWKSGLPCPPS
jgi:hypothetical protein